MRRRGRSERSRTSRPVARSMFPVAARGATSDECENAARVIIACGDGSWSACDVSCAPVCACLYRFFSYPHTAPLNCIEREGATRRIRATGPPRTATARARTRTGRTYDSSTPWRCHAIAVWASRRRHRHQRHGTATVGRKWRNVGCATTGEWRARAAAPAARGAEVDRRPRSAHDTAYFTTLASAG
jgi:hypothetical protein